MKQGHSVCECVKGKVGVILLCSQFMVVRCVNFRGLYCKFEGLASSKIRGHGELLHNGVAASEGRTGGYSFGYSV